VHRVKLNSADLSRCTSSSHSHSAWSESSGCLSPIVGHFEGAIVKFQKNRKRDSGVALLCWILLHITQRAAIRRGCATLSSYVSDNELCYLFRRSGLPIGTVYGPGSGPMWLSNVNCVGDENALEDCTHNGWGSASCDHYEDISISCAGNLTNDIGKI